MIQNYLVHGIFNMGTETYETCPHCAESEAPVSNLSQVLTNDPVNKPAHYREHPSGIECIQVTEHMGFNLGNAIKYIWRCDLKKDAIEDLEKAKWYIQREIEKRKK